jgi:hypothetical protein
MRGFNSLQHVTMLAIGLAVIALVLLKSPQERYAFPLDSPEPQRQWAVEVTGGVKIPGIYIFSHPPTASQVLARAGGLRPHPIASLPGGDEELSSGARLDVRGPLPTELEIHRCEMCAKTRLVLGIPLDVNRVQTGDLALVPGISQGLASRIVENREACGPFTTWDDLRRVRGVGPVRIRTFQDYLTMARP